MSEFSRWNDVALTEQDSSQDVRRPFRLNHDVGAVAASGVGGIISAGKNRRERLRARHLAAKRALDFAASAAGLLALLPLFIIIAVVIKATSKGPVFFRQQREGYLGKPFVALKFRSMSIDKGDATGVAQTVKNDARVTPIGRFLRSTSIDELPQLINVLAGDMSLVGPRPHVYNMRAGGMLYRELVPYYEQRLHMLPGLTGLAQANGLRGPTDNAERAKARVDMDIEYIRKFSFWLDIAIILKTIRHEFVGGSAH